jgi:AcrR family transcriptional regulator
LSRDEVVRNQRSRIVEAIADVSSVVGYAAMSVEDIIATAGISRRSFYDYYSSKEDGFVQAYDDISGRVLSAVREAYDEADGFASRIEAAIGALLQFFAQNPDYAEMCLVQVMSAGPDAVALRDKTLQQLTELIVGAADRELPKRGRPPELIAEGIVGGIYEILYARVIRGRIDQLPDLLPDLAYSALLPYLGATEAANEQRRLRRRAGRSA